MNQQEKDKKKTSNPLGKKRAFEQFIKRKYKWLLKHRNSSNFNKI